MDIATEFLERSRHFLADEYPTKIRRCLDVLPGDALWRRSDEQANSVANLLLHLAGNVGQWIVSSIGGAPGTRCPMRPPLAREMKACPPIRRLSSGHI